MTGKVEAKTYRSVKAAGVWDNKPVFYRRANGFPRACEQVSIASHAPYAKPCCIAAFHLQAI
jgi:hypothetical protein